MARNGADVLSKKNSKLHSFLKRNLDVDTYERVRASEACIVCSEKEDKAFKFVVLSDEWIYLTENPPKKIYETVFLADIVSVTLAADYPEFLSGAERENTQHVVVKYNVAGSKKGGKSKKNGKDKKKGESQQESPPSTGRSPRTARSSIVHLDRGSLTSRSADSGHQWQRKAASWKGKDSKRQNMPRTSSVGTEMMQTDNRKLSNSSILKSASETNLANKSRTSANLAATMLNRYASTTYDDIQKRPRPLPNPAEEWDENGELLDKRKREPLHVRYGDGGELKLDLHKLDSLSDEEDDGLDKNSLAPPGDSRRKLSSGSSSPRMSSLAESDGGDEGFEDDDSALPVVREAVLHLYILSYSSPILMLTRSAWNNYLIRSTMQEDPEHVYRTMAVTPRGTSTVASEKLERLFCQLKTDLMNPKNSMEEIFDLMCELKCAGARNPAIKKLFWKTSEMLQFIVHQLQTYLPRSPVHAHMSSLVDSEEEQKQMRADEFELILVLVETLSVMLRETEMVASRQQCLKAAAGKTTRDLLVVLTCFPEVPQKYVPPSTKAQQLLNSSDRDAWKCLADVDLSKLLQEFTNTATAVLYELILIAHQANWGDSDGSFLNICWMIKILDELNTTDKFVERLVSEMMRLISPSHREQLSPSQAVLVYQQLHVLQTLLQYSAHTEGFIRNNFYEEFKYYIQAPIISQKMPSSYAIRPHAVHLLEEVMSDVLQKVVKLDIPV